jgi:hypothetical protein
MLSSKYRYSVDEVLEALYILIDEYYYRHNCWLVPSNKNSTSLHDRQMQAAKNSALVDYVKILYPYVYQRQFNLSGTDFVYDPSISYPYCVAPTDLYTAAYQLYAFWISFLGSDFHDNVYIDERIKPLNILAVESYLRIRLDFADPGRFINDNLKQSDGFSSTVSDKQTTNSANEPQSALFTIGEVSYISIQLSDEIRAKATGNKKSIVQLPYSTRPSEGESKYKTSEIPSYVWEVPTYLEDFFLGKIGESTKSLLRHHNVVVFLSVQKKYTPTRFYFDSENKLYDIPNYAKSGNIHKIVNDWVLKNRNKTSIESFLKYIYAMTSDTDVSYEYYKYMEKNKVSLSFLQIILINNFLVKYSGKYDPADPFAALLGD